MCWFKGIEIGSERENNVSGLSEEWDKEEAACKVLTTSCK